MIGATVEVADFEEFKTPQIADLAERKAQLRSLQAHHA